MSTNLSSTDRSNAGKIGGHILVDCLRAHGVELVFAVPGESYLAVLDGLVDAPEIRTVVCRQEGGAAMMAEAYGKLTGKPGIRSEEHTSELQSLMRIPYAVFCFEKKNGELDQVRQRNIESRNEDKAEGIQ